VATRHFVRDVLPGFVLAAFFCLFVFLGRWQLQRMHEKEALLADFEAARLITLPLSNVDLDTVARYQHVIVTGRYDGTHQILLDNMTHEGRVGYRVLTPLTLASHKEGDASVVLVDRGWIPAGATREQLPDVSVSDNLRGLSGLLDESPRAGIRLKNTAQGTGNSSWPRVMNYPSMEELHHALDRRLYPRIILLDAGQADGFVREWKPSSFPPERHFGYAITWFSLAATVAVVALALAVIRIRRRKS
jgi:surfeit locus 1 family protein